MRRHSQLRPQIPRQRADVGPRAHTHPDLGVGPLVAKQFDGVDRHLDRLEDDRFPFSCTGIGPLTVDLLGTVDRGHLLLRAPEASERRCNILGAECRVRSAGAKDTRTVVGVRALPQPHRGAVHLRHPVEEPRQPGRLPRQHHQESRREGVERPGVSHALDPQRSPDDRHHVERGDPRRLVDQQRPVNRRLHRRRDRRPDPGAHSPARRARLPRLFA